MFLWVPVYPLFWMLFFVLFPFLNVLFGSKSIGNHFSWFPTCPNFQRPEGKKCRNFHHLEFSQIKFSLRRTFFIHEISSFSFLPKLLLSALAKWRVARRKEKFWPNRIQSGRKFFCILKYVGRLLHTKSFFSFLMTFQKFIFSPKQTCWNRWNLNLSETETFCSCQSEPNLHYRSLRK